MRRVWRPSVHPPELTRAGRPGFDYAEGQRLGTQPRDKFPPHWRSPDVRGVLKAMCGEACAYCLDIVGRPGEDVEHYRPKDLYWFLAYSPENYLSSCRRCNSSRKSNRFPLDSGAVQATDMDGIRTERRRLIDPVTDDVERAMRIELASNTYNWVVDPTAPLRLRRRAEHTIEFFRLNRDAELRRARIKAIGEYLALALKPDPESAKAARLLASRFVPHGAAVRSVVRQQNPDLLPTLEEELQGHISNLAATLALTLDDPVGEADRVQLYTYALATIRADPPTGIKRSTVAAWYAALSIAASSLADRVAPTVAELRSP